MNKLLLHAFYMLMLLFTTVGIASGENASGSGWDLTGGVLTIQSDDGWVDKENYTTHKSDVTSIVIAEGVTSVPNDAFYMGDRNPSFSMNIQKITIPSTVTSIGDNAFIKLWRNGTTDGIDIEGGENVTSVGERAFYCSKVNGFASFTKLKTIGKEAFYGTYQNMTVSPSIQIPASVESIGERAFQQSFYKEITFQAGSQLKAIEDYAFTQLRKATTITIPKNVTTMGRSVFAESKLLKTIQFEKGIKLTEIKTMTFSSCTELTAIEIPASVTTIYDATFLNCGKLESVTFEEGSMLEKFVMQTGHPSFKGCTLLKSITLPGNLKNIYYKTFYESSLENITFTGQSAPAPTNKLEFTANIKEIIIPQDATGYDGEYWQVEGIQDKIFEKGALRLSNKNISLKYDNGWKYKEEGLTEYTTFSGTISGKSPYITITIENGTGSPATKLMFDNAEVGTLTTNINVEVGDKRKSAITTISGSGALLADRNTDIPHISTVSFTKPSEGTIQLFADGKPITSGTKVSKGALLTIGISPASGYRLKGLPLVNKGNVKVTQNDLNYTFTMPDATASITAEFEMINQVKIGALQHGEITADPQTAGVNETIALTITPSPGYGMKKGSLSVKDVSASSITTTVENNTITFLMPTTAVTVTAQFELLPLTLTESNAYTIKYKQEGNQWIYTENTGEETPFTGIIKGATTGTVTIESLPDDNQLTFEDATLSTLSIGDNVMALVKGKATISALSGNGILYTSDDNIQIKKGALTLDVKEMNGSTTEVSVNGITLTPGMLKAPAHTQLSIAVTTVNNYIVKSVTVNNNAAAPGKDNTYSYEVKGNETNLSVAVAVNYPITLATLEQGKITAQVGENKNPNPLLATEGDKVTLTIVPDPGYKIKNSSLQVTANDESSVDTENGEDGNVTFTMPAQPVTVTATVEFELLPLTLDETNDYTIKYNPEGNQWIYTENTGEETPFTGIIKGATTGTVTVTSLPDDNQLTFEDATINTLSIGDNVMAFVKGKATISDLSGNGILYTSDDNITIEKGALPLSIKEMNGSTTEVSVNGQKLTSGLLKVSAQTQLSIAVTIAENSSIKSLKVNNYEATAGDNNTYNYEVQGTESDLSIVVTLNYLITLKTSEHGKITARINDSDAPAPQMATEGDKVTLSFQPETNYNFTGWTVVDTEGQTIHVSADNTFTMPDNPVIVEAQTRYNPPYIPPTPTNHTVIVPEVEGVSTEPVAGSYEVEDGESFHFYLTLDKEYSQSSPIVTTDRSETITPRSSDGAYIIKYVRQPIAISIDGIIKNPDPVANETIDANSPKVWTKDSYLHLQTPQPETVFIYTFNGTLLKKLTKLSGNKTLWLPQGNYIVLIGKERFKVQVK
jgi:hypothetical protein